MTDKEKQIEGMAKDLDEARDLARATVGSLNNGFGGWYARQLYNKGYRKESEVVKEFIEKFKQRFFFMNGTMLSSPVYQCTGKELERFAAEYGVEVEK